MKVNFVFMNKTTMTRVQNSDFRKLGNGRIWNLLDGDVGSYPIQSPTYRVLKTTHTHKNVTQKQLKL